MARRAPQDTSSSDLRLGELILAALERVGGYSPSALGETLWALDGEARVRLGATFSRAGYLRAENGPEPSDLSRAIEALVSKGAIDRDARGALVAKRLPNLDAFDPAERELLPAAMERAVLPRKANEKRLWMAYRVGEEIPVGLSLVDDGEPGEWERTFAKKLAKNANAMMAERRRRLA